jgi:hypothetical protein
MLPIMQSLSQKKEIVEEVLRLLANEGGSVTSDKIERYLRAKTLNIIDDSEKIIKEFDNFTSAVSNGKADIERNIKLYPFLAEVWYGDVFDGKEGIDALQHLIFKLEDDLNKIDHERFIQEAVNKFRSK